MRQISSSKASATFQEQIHVSLLSSKTYQKTEKSHMDFFGEKEEEECVRLTVGGDRLDYPGDVATSTADITTFKFLINSTISTTYAAMMMMYIKNYYTGTPLPRYEYMLMLLLLNYSHSRNPPCAPSRTHGQIQAPREPPN
jgi:hypothetical protein